MKKVRIRIIPPKGYNREFPAKLRAAAKKLGITPQQMHERKEAILGAWKNRQRVGSAHDAFYMIDSGAKVEFDNISVERYCDGPPEHDSHIGIAKLVSGFKHKVNTSSMEHSDMDGDPADFATGKRTHIPEDQFFDEEEA